MSSLPKPRRAVLRKLSDPKTGDAIDHALVLWFPGMGMDVCKHTFYCHISLLVKVPTVLLEKTVLNSTYMEGLQ